LEGFFIVDWGGLWAVHRQKRNLPVKWLETPVSGVNLPVNGQKSPVKVNTVV
jgi:hypothetical protein